MTFDSLPRCHRLNGGCDALFDPASVVEVAVARLKAMKTPYSRWMVEADASVGLHCGHCIARQIDNYDGASDQQRIDAEWGPPDSDPLYRAAMIDAGRARLLR